MLLYLDPGAGSLVIQAVLATVLAVPFFLRTHIAALIGRIRGSGRADAASRADEG